MRPVRVLEQVLGNGRANCEGALNLLNQIRKDFSSESAILISVHLMYGVCTSDVCSMGVSDPRQNGELRAQASSS